MGEHHVYTRQNNVSARGQSSCQFHFVRKGGRALQRHRAVVCSIYALPSPQLWHDCSSHLSQVQQALDQAHFTLRREAARRARLEKKLSELEERGIITPRSVSPRSPRSELPTRRLGEAGIHQCTEQALELPSTRCSLRFILNVCMMFSFPCGNKIGLHTASKRSSSS